MLLENLRNTFFCILLSHSQFSAYFENGIKGNVLYKDLVLPPTKSKYSIIKGNMLETLIRRKMLPHNFVIKTPPFGQFSFCTRCGKTFKKYWKIYPHSLELFILSTMGLVALDLWGSWVLFMECFTWEEWEKQFEIEGEAFQRDFIWTRPLSWKKLAWYKP